MEKYIKPPRLQKGHTIGIIAPSYCMKADVIKSAADSLTQKGFNVKFSKYLFSDAHGYAGSVEERAFDFNNMIADDDVRMLLFGGGEVCNEILPYIDYETLLNTPKLYAAIATAQRFKRHTQQDRADNVLWRVAAHIL